MTDSMTSNGGSLGSRSLLEGRPGDHGGFSQEVQRWMARRAEAFQRATQAKGKPVTYGSGKAA